LNTTSSLEGLQTEKQRLVLDTIAQIRKCGLESVLSLPQLVVCGDQSAGKSSVLEALTEIPFPRNDNLCTRFATEIILRRATTTSLTIKVIPGTERTSQEQETIKAFNESITDLADLPALMDKAMAVMGIDNTLDSNSTGRAFARDVLSIEIENPTTPQLTLVDLPGLIQNETKGVTRADVDLVTEITNHYISQPRTICLAVITATNDYSNQGILTKVRKFDPSGERTLGIITKPDRLSAGSGAEQGYLTLARNEDVFLKLGWHVLKNRSFEEGSSSFLERNIVETTFFRTSNFKKLPKENVGIDALRSRLSRLLFNHVKQELPKLREDLDTALSDARSQLSIMGNRRATIDECKSYLTQLSLDCHEVCKAAVDGHYEGDYFSTESDQTRRLRAHVQIMNEDFANVVRLSGHKYHIGWSDQRKGTADNSETLTPGEMQVKTGIVPPSSISVLPIKLSYPQAIAWVGEVLIKTRGRELTGNFNPLLIGQLFWEQSSGWQSLATEHLEQTSDKCSGFLRTLLEEKCPKDILSRLWPSHIQDALKARFEMAATELHSIMQDVKNYPINYNHYYTDLIKKRQQDRQKKSLKESIKDATSHTSIQDSGLEYHDSVSIDVDQVMHDYSERIDPDMGKHSCEQALDCMFAIYKACGYSLSTYIISQPVNPSPRRSPRKLSSPTSLHKLSSATSSAALSESSRPLQ